MGARLFKFNQMVLQKCANFFQIRFECQDINLYVIRNNSIVKFGNFSNDVTNLLEIGLRISQLADIVC